MVGRVRPRRRELTGTLIENCLRRNRRCEHLRLIVLLVLLVVNAETDVEQQAVRLCARPFRDGDETGRCRLNSGGLWRNVPGDAPVVAYLVLLVVIVRELVL